MADEAEMEQAHPAGTGVLKRLLQARVRAAEGAGKAPQLPQTAPVTPARATATAIGRAADRLYGLGVRPVEVRPGALTLAELPELLPDPALLAVLQGPGDAVGVMALCPQTVTALIEIQTLGRVTGRPLARRRLTRSDATLCADFIDTFLSELAQEGRGVEGLEEFRGFRYATHIDDARPLALMMEDRAYRSLGLKLLLGGSEAREGRLFLALPQPRPDAERPQPALAQQAEAPAATEMAPVSDSELENFIIAASMIGNLQQNAEMEKAEKDQKAIQILSQAQLTPTRFNSIGAALQTDKNLQARAEQAVTKLRAKQAEG